MMLLPIPEKSRAFRDGQVKREIVPDGGSWTGIGPNCAWLFAALSWRPEVADGTDDQRIDLQVAEGMVL